MDGREAGKRWTVGSKEVAGDRLKHSRGYERGQKFPPICSIVHVCNSVFVHVCVRACCRVCISKFICTGLQVCSLADINFLDLLRLCPVVSLGVKVKFSELRRRRYVLGEVKLLP